MLFDAVDPPLLTVDVVAHGEVVDVVVVGDVDADTADRLRVALAEAIDRYRPRWVVIDCAGLAFLGAAGVTALLRARADAGRHHGEIRLRNTRPAVARLLTLAGLEGVFGVTPTE